MFVLGLLVGTVSSKLSSVGTASSNFILGLVMPTLACYFSDGLWKLLAMAPGISVLSLASSNMVYLAAGCCLMPRRWFGSEDQIMIDACTLAVDVCRARYADC